MRYPFAFSWLFALSMIFGLASAQVSENLLGSSSFRPGAHNWVTAAQSTTAVVDSSVRRADGNALRVEDLGPQRGQSTTPQIPVKRGDESGTRREVSEGQLSGGRLTLRFPEWAQQVKAVWQPATAMEH